MSALTLGTIIVEAGETSGTLTQARAAFHQGRKLFILDSCFQRTDITWPARFEKDGAIRVRTTDDIWNARSEEHTSELQSLMRISYAVFCLKKKNKNKKHDQCIRHTLHYTAYTMMLATCIVYTTIHA